MRLVTVAFSTFARLLMDPFTSRSRQRSLRSSPLEMLEDEIMMQLVDLLCRVHANPRRGFARPY